MTEIEESAYARGAKDMAAFQKPEQREGMGWKGPALVVGLALLLLWLFRRGTGISFGQGYYKSGSKNGRLDLRVTRDGIFRKDVQVPSVDIAVNTAKKLNVAEVHLAVTGDATMGTVEELKSKLIAEGFKVYERLPDGASSSSQAQPADA